MQLIAAFDGISYNKVLEARKNDNVTEKLKQKKNDRSQTLMKSFIKKAATYNSLKKMYIYYGTGL